MHVQSSNTAVRFGAQLPEAVAKQPRLSAGEGIAAGIRTLDTGAKRGAVPAAIQFGQGPLRDSLQKMAETGNPFATIATPVASSFAALKEAVEHNNPFKTAFSR